MKNIAIIAAAFCGLGTTVMAQASSGCYEQTYNYAAALIDQSGITCSLPTSGNASENQAFVGLVLSLNKGQIEPRISAGLRRILVDSTDQITGAEINFSTAGPQDIRQTSLRVIGLKGTRTMLANIGLGYDVADNSLLVNGGVQIQHLRAFVDYKPKDAVWKPQLEVNSFGEIPSAVCDGDVLASTEVFQHLLESNLLQGNGEQLFYDFGDIYGGSANTANDVPYGYQGIRNAAVFNDAGETCLNTFAASVANIPF